MATKPDQDWEPVVLKKTFHKKPVTATGLSKAIAAGQVDIVKRVPTVTHEFKIALQKARVAQKMTQADLAKAVAVKQSVIADYESGKAQPDPAIIAKLSRALGTRLPKNPKKKTANDVE